MTAAVHNAVAVFEFLPYHSPRQFISHWTFTMNPRLLLLSCMLFGGLLASCATLRESPLVGGEWIEATGTAYSPVSHPQGLARVKVVAAAEEDARAKIRRQFDQIEVAPGSTVLQAMEDNPYVWSRIMGMLKDTNAHETVIAPDGAVTVQLRLNKEQVLDIARYGEESTW